MAIFSGIVADPAESQLYLRGFLFAVAGLRMLSVVIGIWQPAQFKSKVYNRRPDLVTPLVGRTFAAWTFVTCMLCVMCALHMEEPTLYLATLGSFCVACLKFTAEVLVYKTMDIRGAAAPFVISTAAIAWLLSGWGTYSSYS